MERLFLNHTVCYMSVYQYVTFSIPFISVRTICNIFRKPSVVVLANSISPDAYLFSMVVGLLEMSRVRVMFFQVHCFVLRF